MSLLIKTFSFIICLLTLQLPLSLAQAPDHYYNPIENINPDPNYTPGNYPLEDTNVARSLFHIEKDELIASATEAGANSLVTLGMGEITFKSIKNETASVLGYFRNYFGVMTLGEGGADFKILIDVNSLDTGVPGRNNRILNLFFESMSPKLGFSSIHFDQIELGAENLEMLADGASHSVKASGIISLNGVSKSISANLIVQQQNGTWRVETAEPISLLISDFAFGDKAYTLMQSCNHKALGNLVMISVKLYFR